MVESRPQLLVALGETEEGPFLDLDVIAEHIPTAAGVDSTGRWVDLDIFPGGYDENGLYLESPYVIEVPAGLAADWDAMAGAALSGGGGTFYHRLYRSDRNGSTYEQLPAAAGSVSMNNYRDATWEAQVSTKALENLNPISDWIKLVAFYDHEGETYEFPLGLYYFRFPKDTAFREMTRWELSGYSPEALLAERAAWDGVVYAAGTSILQQVRTILTDIFGFAPERIGFPPNSEDVVLTTPYVADPYENYNGCFWIRIINGMLNAGGFRAIYCDAEGRFLTEKFVDTEDRPVAATYSSSNFRARFVEGDIEGEMDNEGFANRVVVKSTNSLDTVPIIEMATNRDPNSPTSVLPSGIGYVVQGEPYEYENLASSEEAKKLAKELLKRALSRNRTLSFASIPDYRRGPREVIGLELGGSDGREVARGTWVVNKYEITLPEAGQRPQMSWTVDRYESAALEVG